jgi:gamma-glutamylcyclotransferase (GGCT)/AIG2-like uncharacterized protein YtfP
MPAPQLFAYGTLLQKPVQRRIFGRTIPPAPAEVKNWRVVRTLVRARYPGVVPQEGGRVRGGILALRPGELQAADRYEDSPRLYRRRRVVAHAGRVGVRCWIYVPCAAEES